MSLIEKCDSANRSVKSAKQTHFNHDKINDDRRKDSSESYELTQLVPGRFCTLLMDTNKFKSKSQGALPNQWAQHDQQKIEDDKSKIQVQDFHLPIEMHSKRSLNHLRNRRDSQFHGFRKLKPKRTIHKSGERNVTFINLPDKSWKFFKDFVTTMIEEQWRYTLFIFAVSFFTCWVAFAALWYLIAYAHGDLEIDPETGKRAGDGQMPCIKGATTFSGFLLLSIETQVTTGYGEKYPTEECPEAIFLMICQLVAGIVIDGAMIGIVYAKMVRPPKKTLDLKFSKKAVICQRDGKLCLIFRACDTRQMHSINTKVKVVLFEDTRSMEGEHLGQCQRKLNLENNGHLMLMWPVTVCHTIDSKSPLFDVSAKDLLDKKFEIVVTLTGGSRTTGQTTQARTSYLPNEILWGHRFVNVVHYDCRNENYVAMNENFDVIEAVDTALCSARRLQEVLEEVQSYLETDRSKDFDGIEYDDDCNTYYDSDNYVLDNNSVEEIFEEESGNIELVNAQEIYDNDNMETETPYSSTFV